MRIFIFSKMTVLKNCFFNFERFLKLNFSEQLEFLIPVVSYVHAFSFSDGNELWNT